MQGLANLTCAFAALRQAHHQLFQVVAHVSLRRAKAFSPHDLSALAWAYARLQLRKEELMATISEAAVLSKGLWRR